MVAPAAADAGTVPPGFQDSVVLNGFTNPTAVRFAADGRVFVAEKSGIIKVFDDLNDPTPTTFANLNTNVHNFWDRGLLGMALVPNFPADPWVYVLYTYDAAIGGVALLGDARRPLGRVSDPARPDERRLRRLRPARACRRTAT